MIMNGVNFAVKLGREIAVKCGDTVMVLKTEIWVRPACEPHMWLVQYELKLLIA